MKLIGLICPKCKKKLVIKETDLKVECPKCKTVMVEDFTGITFKFKDGFTTRRKE